MITEEDVVLYNAHIIFEASQIYGKGLEPEDRLMAANEGFLYASEEIMHLRNISEIKLTHQIKQIQDLLLQYNR